jgi:hypothetical protein
MFANIGATRPTVTASRAWFSISRYAASWQPPKRPCGRPPGPQGAKPRAEVQRAYRERRKAAGKALRVIDTWATMTPAEIAEIRERLSNALLDLELRQQDVARLEARNAYLESKLKQVEQHLTNALKDNIVLKKQLAERPRRHWSNG